MNKLRSAETGEDGSTRPVHFSETPEFLEAVAKASAAAVSAAEASMLAKITPILNSVKEDRGEGAINGDALSFSRQLAMAIAEISDQDQGRKRVPPAEMARRAHARAQMDADILKHRRISEDHRRTTGDPKDPGPDAPLYLMLGKAYLDDELVPPFRVDEATKKPYPVSIVWFGVPNEVMKPLNDAAKEIHNNFTISIGGATELVSPQAQAWLGSGGLVVAGMSGVPVSMQKHRALPNPEEMAANLYQRGPGEFDPRRDRINILGSIAEPARQTGAPEPKGF